MAASPAAAGQKLRPDGAGIRIIWAVETLFDHNPSPEELRYLFLSGMTREEYLASTRDLETEFGHIYALYMIRGRRDKALEYLNRIRDPRNHFNPKPRDEGAASA